MNESAARAEQPGRFRRYFTFADSVGDNPWLDLLRVLAIVLVLARHGHRAQLGGAESVSLGWTDFLLLNGWFGVDLFFVLSGYLIARNFMRERQRAPSSYLTNYLKRRAFRILPAYYAAVLVTALGLFPLYVISQENLGLRLAYHMLLLQDYLPSNINIVFWSLGVEVKFYLLAPILISVMLIAQSRRWIGVLVLGLILLSPLARWLAYIQAGSPTNYESFWPILRSPFHVSLEALVLGTAVAVLQTRGHLRLSALQAKCILAGSLIVLFAWSASHDFMARTTLFDATLQPLLIALIFAVAVAACAALSNEPLFGRSALNVGSKLSYSLYLVHYPLLPASVVLAASLGGHAIAFWLSFIVLSTLAALCLHFAVEKPFLVKHDFLAPRSRLTSAPLR
jgi:peptidoglycan/LPS O-acetylase OafA/YrhL